MEQNRCAVIINRLTVYMTCYVYYIYFHILDKFLILDTFGYIDHYNIHYAEAHEMIIIHNEISEIDVHK